MKMKIIISLAIAIVVIAGEGVGGFLGGRAYERDQANTVRDNFFRDRGIQGFNLDVNPGAGGAAGQFRAFGGGAAGQIKSIDGNTLILTTPQNEIKVTLSDTTRIEKTTVGVIADLQAGLQVMVTGQRDSDGNLDAVQVTILPLGSNLAPSGAVP